MMFGFYLAKYGGKFENPDGTAAFKSTAGISALRCMKSLLDHRVMVPDPLGQSATRTREYLAANETRYTL